MINEHSQNEMEKFRYLTYGDLSKFATKLGMIAIAILALLNPLTTIILALLLTFILLPLFLLFVVGRSVRNVVARRARITQRLTPKHYHRF